MALAPSDLNRFSKLLHRKISQLIFIKMIIKDLDHTLNTLPHYLVKYLCVIKCHTQ